APRMRKPQPASMAASTSSSTVITAARRHPDAGPRWGVVKERDSANHIDQFPGYHNDALGCPTIEKPHTGFMVACCIFDLLGRCLGGEGKGTPQLAIDLQDQFDFI